MASSFLGAPSFERIGRHGLSSIDLPEVLERKVPQFLGASWILTLLGSQMFCFVF